MKVSVLTATLIAAGFGFGMQAVSAQNVNSDQDKARVEEQTMQNKESGAQGSSADQSSQQQGAQADESLSNASADRSQNNGKASKDMKVHDQSKADDEMARAENGQAKPDSAAEQAGVPAQSNTSVGHPKEAKTTGQGQGVKEQGTGSTADQSGSSAQGSSAQGSSSQGSSTQGSSSDPGSVGAGSNPTQDSHSVPADNSR